MLAPRPRPAVPVPTRPLLLLTVALVMLATLPLTQVRIPAAHTPPHAPVAAPDFGRLPLSFVPNAGQTDPAVRFQVRGMGGTIFFTDAEVVLALPTAQARTPRPDVRASDRLGQDSPPVPQPPTVVRMQFAGVTTPPTVTGAERLPGIVNYFIGSDPAQWRTNLPTYAGIVYAQLYPGVALRYDGAEGRLKGTYTVAPGADPAQIAWRYTGADRVSVDEKTGDLHLQLTNGTTLTEQAPVAWQTLNGERTPVAARYQLTDDGHVRFALGHYDRAHPLVIDPTLVYSTYLGGSGSDGSSDIAVDSAGNAYVTGHTISTNFPIANALQPVHRGSDDAFVTKLNAAGNILLYSTYLGGSGSDGSSDIAVDSAGNAYVTGQTISTNFPTVNALHPVYGGLIDAFVTKLSAAGSTLVYSTYLGGSNIDQGFGITADGTGNAYVTGRTRSTNFPTANALQPTFGGGAFPYDAFVTKLNAAGSTLLYSTYLGGSGDDSGFGIAVDSAGNAYVTGDTSSTNFPTANALQPTLGGTADAFVTKLNAAGSTLLYSTYLGGSSGDQGLGIAVDSAGNAYVTGGTNSTNFPTVNALQPTTGDTADAFVTKLNAAGSTLLYSTYLGGSSGDQGYDIAVDSAGNAYVTGFTSSTNFPIANALQPTFGGGTIIYSSDAFVTKLNAAGSTLLYSTYLGGRGDDWGRGIAADGTGNAYVTGDTYSTDFPTVNALQPAFGGGFTLNDAFVAKIGVTLATPVVPPAAPPLVAGVWDVPFYAQGATQWGSATIGTCGDTIHNVGCALTSLAMIFQYYGANQDPGTLNRCMGTAACPLAWGSPTVKSCSGGKVVWDSWPGFSYPGLEQALQRGPVILEIAQGDAMHFIVVVGGSGSDPHNYTINDPGVKNGLRTTLSNTLASHKGYAPVSMRLYRGAAGLVQASGTRELAPARLVSPQPAAGEVITGTLALYRNTETAMTLELAAQSSAGAITEMLIWTDQHANDTWQPFSAYVDVPLDGAFSVKFRDASGNMSAPMTTSVPSAPSSIQQDAVYLPFIRR